MMIRNHKYFKYFCLVRNELQVPNTPQWSFDVLQNNSVSYFLLDSLSDYKERQRLHSIAKLETGRSS